LDIVNIVRHSYTGSQRQLRSPDVRCNESATWKKLQAPFAQIRRLVGFDGSHFEF
jgi:hypothetical protein